LLDEPAITLTDEEDASFEESFAQEERGEFVPEDEVCSFWEKVGVPRTIVQSS
jgi:predicted transcriptional regulator